MPGFPGLIHPKKYSSISAKSYGFYDESQKKLIFDKKEMSLNAMKLLIWLYVDPSINVEKTSLSFRWKPTSIFLVELSRLSLETSLLQLSQIANTIPCDLHFSKRNGVRGLTVSRSHPATEHVIGFSGWVGSRTGGSVVKTVTTWSFSVCDFLEIGEGIEMRRNGEDGDGKSGDEREVGGDGKDGEVDGGKGIQVDDEVDDEGIEVDEQEADGKEIQVDDGEGIGAGKFGVKYSSTFFPGR